MMCFEAINLHSHFVAFLYRIEMAFAEAATDVQFSSDQQCIKFQLALAKISSTPFGVPLHGMRTPVSFSMVFKGTGLVLSIFLFLIGYRS